MMENFLLQTYLYVYQIYSTIWKYVFSVIGQIMFLYYYDGINVRNITWNYYFGFGLESFTKGIYYAKIYNARGMNHFGYRGKLDELTRIKISNDFIIPKRKNVLLLNNGIPLEVDLDVLDNYRVHSSIFGVNSINNLPLVLRFLGLNCSHVKIFQTVPFIQQTIPIDKIDINSLYLD